MKRHAIIITYGVPEGWTLGAIEYHNYRGLSDGISSVVKQFDTAAEAEAHIAERATDDEEKTIYVVEIRRVERVRKAQVFKREVER